MVFKSILIFTCLALTSGCWLREKRAKVFPLLNPSVGAPGKEHALLVNGRPLSIHELVSIHSSLKDPTKETALWVGAASLAAVSDVEARGHHLDSKKALDLARYAINETDVDVAREGIRTFLELKETDVLPPPADIRRQLDSLLVSSMIQRNSNAIEHAF